MTLKAVLQKWKNEPESLAAMSQRAKKWATRYERDTVLGLYETELLKLVSLSEIKARMDKGELVKIGQGLEGKNYT
jgi:hypothetical protein